jgi:hypothetical protein
MSLIWSRLLRAAQVRQGGALQALWCEETYSIRNDVRRLSRFDALGLREGAEPVQPVDQ